MESGDSIQLSTGEALTELDLDAIETDLADVEVALARLEAGTYWTCEVTGQALDDELLTVHPTARRLPGV
jgi:RNA polymerase-binding transcription factor DksA